MSTLNVDKVDPSTGTDLELGTSGDTVTVPSGVGLTLTDSTLLLPTTITSTTEVKTNKISPATGAAFALGDSGDTFTVPSGATIVNSGTATGFGITAASFRPNAKGLIINGDCAVAQRGTSFATMGNGDSQYTLDRFQWSEEGGFGVAELTITQDTDVPTGQGFAKSLKAVCTTIDTSIDSNTISYITQKFEGQNLQLLKKGTANAEKLTLSFWAKSNLTGTFTMAFKDTDNSRLYSTSYSPASADTWEKFIVNIPADTTGAFTDDNATSLAVDWNLQAGTDKSDGALTTAWEAQAEGDRAVGQTNFFSSTSNDFYITGIQLEVGEYTSATLPPFQHESYGDNLARCQRYFYQCCNGNDQEITGAWYFSTSMILGILELPVPMRSNPTLAVGGTTDQFIIWRDGGSDNFTALTRDKSSNFNTRVSIYNNNQVSGTAGQAGCVRSAHADASLTFDAEL